MSSKTIETLQQEIKSTLTYYEFWDQARHLPNSAQTANYFATRLQKLRKQLDDLKCKQDNPIRERGKRSGVDPNEQ